MITILCGDRACGKTEFMKRQIIPTLTNYLIIDNAYEYRIGNSVCPFYYFERRIDVDNAKINAEKLVLNTQNDRNTTIIFEFLDCSMTEYGFKNKTEYYNWCLRLLQERSGIFVIQYWENCIENLIKEIPAKIYLWDDESGIISKQIENRTQETEIVFKKYRDTF